MTRKFADLGVAPALIEALAKRGYETAFAIQELAIEDAIAGRDICGKAQTGSGKTLAFGIPVVQRLADAPRGKVQALMLVPTRELANQVMDELAPLCEAVDLSYLAVYGGADIDKQIRAIDKGCRDHRRYSRPNDRSTGTQGRLHF